MKQEIVEVKAKGQTVDTIEVNQFESVKEAEDTLTYEAVLQLINRQYKTDLTNAARAAKTRTASPMRKLMKLAETDKNVKAQVEALFKQYGIEMPAEPSKE